VGDERPEHSGVRYESDPQPSDAPALACVRTLQPPQPQQPHEFVVVESEVVLDEPAIDGDVAPDPSRRLRPRPPSAPDGHTPPRQVPSRPATDGDTAATGPALRPEDALERLRISSSRPRDTVGGHLDYALVTVGSTRAYAAGTYKGQVKLVVELQRQLGGGWEVVNHSGCSADLVGPA
jgi:hypothetical protein